MQERRSLASQGNLTTGSVKEWLSQIDWIWLRAEYLKFNILCGIVMKEANKVGEFDFVGRKGGGARGTGAKVKCRAIE